MSTDPSNYCSLPLRLENQCRFDWPFRSQTLLPRGDGCQALVEFEQLARLILCGAIRPALYFSAFWTRRMVPPIPNPAWHPGM
jgi:hypothetical protein